MAPRPLLVPLLVSLRVSPGTAESTPARASATPVNFWQSQTSAVKTIDRAAVVARHAVRFVNPRPIVGGQEFCTPNSSSSAFSQLTVGNGDFAFTTDLTGLQSLNRSYGSNSDFGFPALTQASWGWHTPDFRKIDPTMPSPWLSDGSLNLTLENVSIASLDGRPGHGNRTVPYLLNCQKHNDPRLCAWWYNFPVRQSLGQLGFVTVGADGGATPLVLDEIRDSSQEHDLYTSVVSANWSIGEYRVRVVTVGDDESSDGVASQFTAPTAMGLTVQLAFCAPATLPMGTHKQGNVTIMGNGGNAACDWRQPAHSHQTTTIKSNGSRLDVARKLEFDEYSVSCTSTAGTWKRTGPHSFVLDLPALGSERLAEVERTVSVSCRWGLSCCVGNAPSKLPNWLSEQPVSPFIDVYSRAVESAKTYWESGAFVDLAGATSDPRAAKLERIVIQSQALLRTMETGAAPPQESGLMFNSWSGKHHQEMRLWHQAWLPVWGRPALMDRSWRWFLDNLPNATSEARRQGYKGQRVHKMVGEANPRGFGNSTLLNWESANDCNPTLLWHQPWVVMLAELQYKAANTDAERKSTLWRLSPLVFATADFLADFAEKRADAGGTRGKHYDLGPPLMDAAEDQGPAANAHNPTFELTQVKYALDVAIQWRERLGLSEEPAYATILAGLAPAPIAVIELYGRNQSVYNRHQSCLPSVFAESASGCQARNNHMAMLGAFGVLPGERFGIDPTIMNATMHAVCE
eukprot:COSAG02_NODE_2349_length_9084_cov_12.922315_7_plen_745_part_00